MARPPRSSPSNRLPRRTTAFVGRARELAALHAWFAGPAPLCTLTGLGGMGKTRLALEFAATSARALPGGAWFCDVSTARDAQGLVLALARGLDVPLTTEGAHDADAQRVTDALSAREPSLIVIDNCEQLGFAAAPMIERVLEQAAPGTRLLATSRTALGVAGEHREPIGAMDPSDAVALFDQRARASSPGFAMDPETRDTVQVLTTRLAGTPLAIELAASRVDLLGVREIHARLDQRFALLRATPDDPRDARHAALWNTLSWSWQLLDAPMRATLVQCTAFRGPFTAEAAEAVVRLASDTPVLDVLHSLRWHSLLTRIDAPDAPRLGLDENVRAFAEAQAESTPDAAGARDRHVAYQARRARDALACFDGPDEPAAFAWLADAEDELITAHRHARAHDPTAATSIALALHRLAILRGPYGPHRAMLDHAVEDALATRDLAQVVATRLARAELAALRGDAAGVREDAAYVLEHGDDDSRGAALCLSGRQARREGRIAEARAAIEQAVAIHRTTGTASRLGQALRDLAGTYWVECRYAEARQPADEAWDVLHALGAPRLEGLALVTRAVIAQHAGQPAEAHRLHLAALAAHEAADDRRAIFVTLVNLAGFLHESGDLDAAEGFATRARAAARAHGDRVHESQALGQLGVIVLERGRPAEARSHLESALSLHRTSGDHRLIAWIACYLSVAALEQDDDRNAAVHIATAMDAARTAHHPEISSMVRLVAGVLDARADSLETATAHWNAARADLGTLPAVGLRQALDVVEGLADLSRARARATAGDTAGSREAYECARARRALATDAARAGSGDVRWVARMLDRALATGLADEDAPVRVLRIGPEVRWFDLPDGTRVELRRQRAMRLILGALIELHDATPDRALALDAIVSAGWPGEKMSASSGVNRAYVALTRLRNLGLRSLLESRDDGVRIASDVRIVRG